MLDGVVQLQLSCMKVRVMGPYLCHIFSISFSFIYFYVFLFSVFPLFLCCYGYKWLVCSIHLSLVCSVHHVSLILNNSCFYSIQCPFTFVLVCVCYYLVLCLPVDYYYLLTCVETLFITLSSVTWNTWLEASCINLATMLRLCLEN